MSQSKLITIVGNVILAATVIAVVYLFAFASNGTYIANITIR